ncbi:Hypothetical protein A7982_00895 [Minicystis rosea]|nr:Hypothetical protein A7982_00895 [Minicystis rosea]
MRHRNEIRQLEWFVGRRAELRSFEDALDRGERAVFYVSGPAGVGKTSLLRAFETAATTRDIMSTRVDARDIELTLPAFRSAVEQAMSAFSTPPKLGPRVAGPAQREHPSRFRGVLFIDAYEYLKPIEPLLLHQLLDTMAPRAMLVLAGRSSPSAEWRALPTWRTEVLPIALRNLSPDESTEYLHRRGIHGDVAINVSTFSHGHPLALALAADARRNAPETPFSPEREIGIVTALYDYFVRAVEQEKREALEAAAVLHTISEPMLGVMTGRDPARLFSWLRELSFVEIGRRGLLLHDLARDVILAELRWRNPARLAALVLRAQEHNLAALRVRSGPALLETLDAFTFVVGHNPELRMMMVHPDDGLSIDRLRAGDDEVLQDIVLRHEGPTSRARLLHWLRCQPGAFRVVRNGAGEVVSFGAYLRLDATTPADRDGDPIVASAFELATRLLGGRPEKPVIYARFLTSVESAEAPSKAIGMCVHAGTRLLFSESVKIAFIRQHDTEMWEPLVTMSGARRVPELAHTEDSRRYEVALQDLRDVSLLDWIAKFNERAAIRGWGENAGTSISEPSLAALSKQEFAAFVREALRALNDPLVLSQSPLVHSMSLLRRDPAASAEERAGALRKVLLEAMETLHGSAKGKTWHRALEAAYVEAAGKHEQIAEDLGLSYTTFRRHMRAGIEHIVSVLWQREREL